MRLQPKRPQGRSSRKALRFVREVRRLRAEGHTLESIRLALLDAGVSVSLSTVRREVARPPSLWELELELEPACAPDVPATLHASEPGAAATWVAAPSPSPPYATSGEPDAPSNSGVFSKVCAVVRRLYRARWFA